MCEDEDGVEEDFVEVIAVLDEDMMAYKSNFRIIIDVPATY